MRETYEKEDQIVDPANIPIYPDDLIDILGDVYSKLNNRIETKENITNKRSSITSDGRLLWIFDRFVDIDFDRLKDLWYIKDTDRLIVLADETHDGQCSEYYVYNTENVPNVRYVGAVEPELYPTIPAVQMFVNRLVAEEVDKLQARINVQNETISKLSGNVQTLIGLVETLTDKLNEEIIRATRAEKEIPEAINATVETKITSAIELEATRANESLLGVENKVDDEISRAKEAESGLDTKMDELYLAHDTRIAALEVPTETPES